MAQNIAEKVPSSIDIQHNTARSHNNFNSLPSHQNSPRIFLSNHTSSFSYTTNAWTDSEHDSSNIVYPGNKEYQRLRSINVLFAAFGRIFDIILYPDHKRIQSTRKEKNGVEHSSSIFYHGHLKGMKKKSEVSLAFHDLELVRLKVSFNSRVFICPKR